MGLQKARNRIWVRGLGNLELRLREPTIDTAFSSAGYLQQTSLEDAFEMEDIIPETGRVIDYLPKQRIVGGVSNLMQSSIDEINLLTAADDVNKVYALRYHGNVEGDPTSKWQYFLFDQARLKPGIVLPFGPTQRSLLCAWRGLYDDSLGYVIPEYMVIEADQKIYVDRLQLWVAPRLQLNLNTSKVLDISGFSKTGTLQETDSVHPSPSAMWVADPAGSYALNFDGTNDNVNFGSGPCNIGTEDFMIEFWVKVPAADGTAQEILGKKTSSGAPNAGYYIERSVANGIKAYLSDGTDQVLPITANSTVLQNVWNHYALAVNRAGNAQPYINGVASGSPVAMSTVDSMSNAVNLYLGRNSTNYGQILLAGVRIYIYSAGLPSDIAAQVLSHYNGEKSYRGL